MTVNAVCVSGASSHRGVNWDSIDWVSVNANVRRLQSRIVKATEQQRWGKVKALQRLLTRSFSAKAMAVKRVSENAGKRTPGVDGVRWNTNRQKASAISRLRQHGYKAKPLRRIYIPKSNGKTRPLGIPTMHDRAMQALYLFALDPCAEVCSDLSSYGFRVGRSCADAMEKCFILLSKKTSARWVLEADIKSCFDKISHEWLLANVPTEKRILRQWLKAGYVEKQHFHQTSAGTPQGIISPALANIALNGLEARLREVFPKAKTMAQKNRVYFVRYADDFIITADSKELLNEKVRPLVESFLQERDLQLSLEKTQITSITDGFDFLGQHVRKYNDKLIISPSKRNVKLHLKAVREFIYAHRSARAGNLIVLLNPIIRGWANYHRHVVSKRTFVQTDHAIFMALWRWALRRHPNKGRRWIADKYFRQEGDRHWVFFGSVSGAKGCDKDVQLFKASSLPIKRHPIVKDIANPYDDQWAEYFARRSSKAKRYPSHSAISPDAAHYVI